MGLWLGRNTGVCARSGEHAVLGSMGPKIPQLVEKLTGSAGAKRRKSDIDCWIAATSRYGPDSGCAGSCFCCGIDLLHCQGRRMTRPLQGALIGFGFIAERGPVPAYLPSPDRLEIVAVADVCAARRERARQVLPKARIYSDTKTLLAAEARQIDFVDIATPPCDHAAIAHAAFEHGLHVFCEKPIATSAADARSMLDHATQVKRVFFPSHNYKHAPVIKAIRAVLESGELGAIHLVTLDTFRTTHAKGVADWQPDWRRSRKTSGGGIAMDHGSHTFYLAFDWLASQPTAITAKMSNLSTFDTEDNLSCTLTFPGGIAVAQLTWTAG